MPIVLSIETSCDKTGVAIVADGVLLGDVDSPRRPSVVAHGAAPTEGSVAISVFGPVV
ncbi:hypothetical protein [Micromonospora yangpuensis]|uniref:tRNA (Adenosine(37)-N6)-threonylcarbamoyltransferase complex transferase subunit TsaD n=1 Tax=Micromonospora yangpuensis TaxID=683228 RepID=A0A1C6UWT8_9ACTN|nr:hypothetical protein [Micromonospora yangpuensis]GGM24999.1 hypothetical protein GCM10012279_49270 [Micromonospora yangpuensis]SCL58525.1 hypothetical protein GA0070617_3843 [Micromonospora yangpuensis]